MKRPMLGVWLLLPFVLNLSRGAAPLVPDAVYPQEIAHRIDVPGATSRVALVEVLPGKVVRFFSEGRWYRVEKEACVELEALRCPQPDEFVFADSEDRPIRVKVPWNSVRQLIRAGVTNWISTKNAIFRGVEGGIVPIEWFRDREIRQVALDPNGRLWVASAGGLAEGDGTRWEFVRIPDGRGREWGVGDVLGVACAQNGNVWVAMRAGIATGRGGTWRFWEGKDGVPYNDFTCVAIGSNHDVWFGTRLGAIRFDGKDFSYRQGPRWLPHDEVLSIVPDGSGSAWFATQGGLGWIERRPMTLAEKAGIYEAEVERYIQRTEYGYTSEVGLARPGDRSEVIPGDSDNDGLWTAMYGAGECFAYAATGREEFKVRARKVFDALRFLQTVTQGGEHSPPEGYVARTIRPTEDPDPNIGRLDADKREKLSGDRLWKVYEPRWPRSSDGKWYWKSDTSSDELDGHFFFYARYFDLVADEPERQRVREVVRQLVDHLIAHDFALVDHDGTPTRWGVFSPGRLNRDADWWVERGLNSLSILSYLAVAEHVTGDSRYRTIARELIDNHGYAVNVMNPKTQSGFGSGNQSDDEMAFMCFFNLLSYTSEKAWREKWMYAFHAYAALELPELNPFFNFAYAAVGLEQTYRNAWGEYSIGPWKGWLEDSVATLRDFSLDRVNWPHRNSHRLDIVLLPAQQSTDLYEPRTQGRGYRVNGKVLPVSERHFNHWNTDPWRLDYGGDGRELASGTVFLLPYYMGLYLGFIGQPAATPLQ